MRHVVLAALALLLAVTAPAVAGYKIEQTMSGVDETAVIYVDSNRIKIGSGQEVIFDIENDLLYMIMPEKQVYWSGSPDELVESIKAVMESAMEGMLAQVPEDQREQYREYMKSMGMTMPGEVDEEEHAVELVKTDDAEEIAGYKTVRYEIHVDGELAEEIWMADDVPVSDEIDIKRFADYAAAMKQFSGEYAYETSDAYLERMATGYPMRTRPYRMGQAGPVTEVTALTEMDVPDSTFEVPESYKKVSLMELQGTMGGPQGDSRAPQGGPGGGMGAPGGAPPSAPGMP